MSYYLVRGNDPAGSDRIEITGEMVVGRSEDCDIRVQEGHPSRRHARLSLEDDKAWLEDLGSANGTFVNDRPLTEKTELRDGDRIAFDLSTFVVAAPKAQDDDATVVRSAPAADPDATVVRPAPEPPEAQTETPEAQPAPSEAQSTPSQAPPGERAPAQRDEAPGKASDESAQPPAETEAEAEADPGSPGGRSDVPRSWADPDFQTAGTRVLTSEELKAMAAGESPAAEGAVADAEGAHLRVISGRSAGQVLALEAGRDEWTVGSDDDRDLRLEDAGISAFHAKISHDDGRWRVIDQMSANGTWVNDEKVTVSYLGNGDRIRFSQVECEIVLPAAGKAAGTSRSATAGRSTARTWVVAVIAAAATVGVLALVAWLA